MELRIVVCAKQVPDPEGPPSAYEVDPVGRQVTAKGLSPVISPFDRNALEVAVRIKEETGAHITLLGAGPSHSKPVLLKTLAVGVDRAVLVEGPELEGSRSDSLVTARLLAAAIGRLDGFDLVLAGRQASDTNAGVVGLALSALLGIPAVSVARDVKLEGRRIIVERVLPDGYEVVTAPLPALVTVSHEAGELRYPHLAAIRKAREIPVMVISTSEPGFSPAAALVETVALFPPDRERNCRLLEQEDQAEAGRELARRLRAEGVIPGGVHQS